MADAAAFPYLATNDYEWTERAFQLLEAERLTVSAHSASGVPGFVVAGPCPRCEHHLTDRQVTVALTGMSGTGRHAQDEFENPESETDAVDAVVLDVTCGCGTAHQDAPEGAAGCGASFRIELVPVGE
ncbi:hypothetical protein [Streptomyces mangrovi]|uniref:hypothetical protein n=1 Tax=Streptomyces mangrovi TaxID=1206892 RepID=UPI00399CA008